jgi:hypothetical protein
VVTVLLGSPPEGVVLDDEERRALDVLAGSGLVPPLRLVHQEEDDRAADPPGMSEIRQEKSATRFVS